MKESGCSFKERIQKLLCQHNNCVIQEDEPKGLFACYTYFVYTMYYVSLKKDIEELKKAHQNVCFSHKRGQKIIVCKVEGEKQWYWWCDWETASLSIKKTIKRINEQ